MDDNPTSLHLIKKILHSFGFTVKVLTSPNEAIKELENPSEKKSGEPKPDPGGEGQRANQRVYKPAFSHEKAYEIILVGKGTHFDPSIVEIFEEIHTQFHQIASILNDQDRFRRKSSFKDPILSR